MALWPPSPTVTVHCLSRGAASAGSALPKTLTAPPVAGVPAACWAGVGVPGTAVWITTGCGVGRGVAVGWGAAGVGLGAAAAGAVVGVAGVPAQAASRTAAPIPLAARRPRREISRPVHRDDSLFRFDTVSLLPP